MTDTYFCENSLLKKIFEECEIVVHVNAKCRLKKNILDVPSLIFPVLTLMVKDDLFPINNNYLIRSLTKPFVKNFGNCIDSFKKTTNAQNTTKPWKNNDISNFPKNFTTSIEEFSLYWPPSIEDDIHNISISIVFPPFDQYTAHDILNIHTALSNVNSPHTKVWGFQFDTRR
jgi:hypothetical protein